MQTEAVDQIGPGHAAQSPAVAGSASQPSVTQDPATQDPAAQDPATQDPATQDPATQDLATPGQAAQWTPPSWEDVVREHSARVYRLAYRLTGNSHDAEDLTQEVFVRVFRSLATYTPGTFEGWLHRITTNLFLDITRRRQRIRFEGLGEETAARLKGAEPTPSQAFDDRHLDHDIAVALADLPPEYRAAVVLCDIEGLTYEEIADALGVKLGTVRSRIHRGRAQLRAALEHRRPRRAAVVRRKPGAPAGLDAVGLDAVGLDAVGLDAVGLDGARVDHGADGQRFLAHRGLQGAQRRRLQSQERSKDGRDTGLPGVVSGEVRRR
jgi:RNA polymerase sigma factor (sigma-70 family)